MPGPGVVCVGGAVIDRKLHLRATAVPATSNPARAWTAAGGVARNVAENLARLGVPVTLVSRLGADEAGAVLRDGLAAAGVGVEHLAEVAGSPTAQYVAVLDPSGDLVIAAADMDVLELIAPAEVDAAWPEAGWVFADCNLRPEVLAHVLARGRAAPWPGTARARVLARAEARSLPPVEVAVDAVSVPKVVRLPHRLDGIGLLFCNRDEALALLHRPGLPMPPELAARSEPVLPSGPPVGSEPPATSDRELAVALRAAGAARVVLTRGVQGVVLADAEGVRELPAAPARVVDVTGAGDALVAGTLAGLVGGRSLDAAVALGTLVAALTVQSEHTVRPDLAARLRDPRPSTNPLESSPR